MTTAARSKIEQWPQAEAQIQKDTDELVARNLRQISEEFAHARGQLAREAEDRKQAEQYRASRLIREEIVTQTLRSLEERYMKEASEERLTLHVDRFVRLMDKLS